MKYPSYYVQERDRPEDTVNLSTQWNLKIYEEGVRIGHIFLGTSSGMWIDSNECAQQVIDLIRKRFPNCK